ncbi:MAG TPA: hypothetical protein PKG74_00435 [Candidatus Colwellbacteria bacterium]|nr:hypothetical protein [Candidatus Colwellbacteria bacterium]
MELKLQLEGDVLKKIKVANEKTRQLFKDAVRDGSTLMMESAIRSTPASTGNLRKSIRREISGSGLRATIFPSVVYGAFLHGEFQGGPAYSKPFTIPAREAREGGTLYRWAKKKGLNPYAVRASIAKKGIKHNPFLKAAAEESTPGVQAIFERALDKLAASLGD